MASHVRTRIHAAPPPVEATVVFDQTPLMVRHGLHFVVTKVAAFVRRVLREEPTLLAELGAWGFIASWSYSLLMYRTSTLPASIAESFERGPYFTMAIVGAVLAVVQLVAMVSLEERPRALCAFLSSLWLAGLAASLLAADGRVPSGLGYVLLSFLSMLAYWRVPPRLVLTFVSGAVNLVRSRSGTRS